MNHIKKLFIITYLVTIPGLSFAQSLSKQDVTKTVTKIASLVKEKYVFENWGLSISESLLKKLNQGKFININDWQSLADSLTITIQALSNDGHLYVRNEPETIKELIESEKNASLVAEDSPGEDPFFYGDEAVKKNFGFSEVKILKDNIGYIKLSEINISAKSLPTLYAAMQFVAHTKALIIDLRDNGGGGSDVGSVLPTYFLPADVVLLEFVSRNGDKQTDKTVTWLTEKKYNNPLFIITNNVTRSAAEAFAFSMQTQKRAKIIGKASAGAAHMNSWFVINDHVFVSISTAAPTIPGTEISWERTGIKPDFEVEAGKEIEFILSNLQ
ncbi:MAG: S41 family peptidase [Bacteroidales bacterium]|nr:S41 family peptidase [Bacteroidales bacterium]